MKIFYLIGFLNYMFSTSLFASNGHSLPVKSHPSIDVQSILNQISIKVKNRKSYVKRLRSQEKVKHR